MEPVAWSDEPTRASLRVIAEAAAAFAGFEHAAIAVERDGMLDVVATCGCPERVGAVPSGRLPSASVADVVAELAGAEVSSSSATATGARPRPRP